MTNLGPAFIALLIASVITAIELITTYYSSTFFTIRSCPYFYLYSLIYGVIALIIVASGKSHIEVVGVSNPWLQAAVVGFSIKAIFHIRLFSMKEIQETDP